MYTGYAQCCLAKSIRLSVPLLLAQPFQASLQAGAFFEDEAEMPAVAAQFNADEMPNSWRMHV